MKYLKIPQFNRFRKSWLQKISSQCSKDYNYYNLRITDQLP